MNLIKVECAFCGKEFFRPRGRVNEAKKFGWKQYCSRKCQDQAKVTKVEKVCANPTCNKKVSRELNQFRKSKSGYIFCSSLCTAIVNNSSRRKIKTCPVCSKNFYGERRYCSNLCRSKAINPNKKSKSEKQKIILNKIKDFYNTQGRIPTKKEKPGLARGAQTVFGTWNKAIEAAGFEPNPVMFAKKYIANDGHKCDSFAEKIIDDWLYSRSIKHQRNISYPNSSYTADFLVKGKFVEFLGLNGELEEYDKNTKLKERLAQKYKLKLIKIFPKDLFPVNHLSEIIRIKNT
jgi:predicted nucleic acid-binding Zn ribbon protein